MQTRHLILFLALGVTGCCSVNKAKNELSTEEALMEILETPRRQDWVGLAPAEIIRSPRGLDAVRRAVDYLNHSDYRVRAAAFEWLISVQSERPGTMDAPLVWRRWLERLEQAQETKRPEWVFTGWKPTRDILFEIVQ